MSYLAASPPMACPMQLALTAMHSRATSSDTAWGISWISSPTTTRNLPPRRVPLTMAPGKHGARQWPSCGIGRHLGRNAPPLTAPYR